MPYWDIRKLSLACLPLLLLIVLIAAGYLAQNGGKLASDELLAGWFCLGAPLILLTIAAVFAIISGPYRGAAVAGHCPRCGEYLGSGDLYCPQCGASAAGWAVPPGMKSHRAKDQGPARPVSRRRQRVSVRVASETTLAAQYIVEQSDADVPNSAELTEECLADPQTARRLYHAAARRLHPDVNQGAHEEAWNHLQDAMEILREHHQME